ncbi:hypothetical protein MTR67_035844 [Solanum verrucosum]|uniref:Uncharacterized protein n=1 Tax=Solanum verrucosum TaxID=315347 RepID=A0AAF0UAX4_SOLVR|nr:hypothetical protein MTR67_035844 [Solanum verrucosum]
MGISSEMRREDSWAKRRESLLIASAYEEDRIRKSRECTQDGPHFILWRFFAGSTVSGMKEDIFLEDVFFENNIFHTPLVSFSPNSPPYTRGYHVPPFLLALTPSSSHPATKKIASSGLGFEIGMLEINIFMIMKEKKLCVNDILANFKF